jgi:NlpC/P60 family/Bacterial dipeptidyl-peptidase Sh3 domain
MIYRSLTALNLYDSPLCDRLASQIAQGEYVQVDSQTNHFLSVVAISDSYAGYLRSQDLASLEMCEERDLPTIKLIKVEVIEQLLPQVIAYALAAEKIENHYLWGGKLPPHFDCSGLVQTAFASVGIQIPRDAYQQEAFSLLIPYEANKSAFCEWLEQLQSGDLIFFGLQKATHVGLYLGDRKYIHCSGQEFGHNRIAIDFLLDPNLIQNSSDQMVFNQVCQKVAIHYSSQLRGAGRIRHNYCRDR